MKLFNQLKSILSGKEELSKYKESDDAKSFEYNFVDEGLLLLLPKEEMIKHGEGENHFDLQALQYSALELLYEEALVNKLDAGFLIPTTTLGMLCDAAKLGEPDSDSGGALSLYKEFSDIFRLPKPYPGAYSTSIHHDSTHPQFQVSINAMIEGEKHPFKYIKGSAEIRLSPTERYTIGSAEILALEAWLEHKKNDGRDKSEEENLRLLTLLNEAKRSGMPIELGHLDHFSFTRPLSVGVNVRQKENGDLLLMPDLGENITPEGIETRLHQLHSDREEGVLRVNNNVVLLEGNALSGVENIIENKFIPAYQAKTFIETPSAFLDGSLVDLDNGFSMRVEGIGEVIKVDFGFTDSQHNDWFSLKDIKLSFSKINDKITSKQELAQVEKDIVTAMENQDAHITFNGLSYLIEDAFEVDTILQEVRERIAINSGTFTQDDSQQETDTSVIEKKEYGVRIKDVREQNLSLLQRADSAVKQSTNIVWSDYARQPFPHQKKGVEWLKGLMQQALKEDEHQLDRLRGCLLADDMGLGKTYMTLVSISEYYRLQREDNQIEKPILIVAPLGLLENWDDEVTKTYLHSVFDDVIILQSNQDLNRFRVSGVAQESQQLKEINGDDALRQGMSKIRYALKVGEAHGIRRLDKKRRLVLTTYDTLRNYQISLCTIDWGMVIFDEAQNIKNANASQTRAAKALKSDFNVLVTGTPIENNLAEFWCLMDTAQPGLLGDYAYFKTRWINPINHTDKGEDALFEIRNKIGQDLREATGVFMLRRTKEEELEDLPIKRVFTGNGNNLFGREYLSELGVKMKGGQLKIYDQILNEHHDIVEKDVLKSHDSLSTLWKLRYASLHPSLIEGLEIVELMSRSIGREQDYLLESGKMMMLLSIIDRVAKQDEKVIIFCITKSLQLLLRQVLGIMTGLQISIINGDTKAVGSGTGVETRKSLIKQFEAKEGFNIIIMSPVAAGTGLTVVGANHVVHLERHWNPAKEAQATDRVYRIGQKRDVSIYFPLLLHPARPSFDEHLDALLQRKTLIKDAVVVPEVVTESDFLKDFF